MCPGSVFWATILKNIDFFFFFLPKKKKKKREFQLNLLLKRLMYIAWACFQNVISVIASQMFYICALVNCFYLIRIKLLLLYC